MCKTLKHILILLVAIFIGALALAITATAVGSSAVQVEYSGLPGSSLNGQINILNTSEQAHTVTISVDECPAESPVPSLAEWITIPKTSFNVNAGGKMMIPYQINIPLDAPAGGYYATLMVTATDKEGLNANQIILLEVDGPTHKEFILRDLSLDADRLGIQIVNVGDVHGLVEGSVEIIDSRGKVVEEIALNKAKQSILPHNAVTYVEDSYTKNLPAGVYNLVINGKADNGQLIQGKITFKTDRTGKIEIMEKYIGTIDINSLKSSAQQEYVLLQTGITMVAFLIFTIAFIAVGRYCIKGV